MRIVIDLQAAQGLSRFRGIGRYSLAFTQALVRNRGGNEIIIALNGMLEESIEPLRSMFETLLPKDNIKVWYGVGPTRPLEADNKWRRDASRLARESFLAALKPDLVLITSLFEGVGDDAVHSIGSLPTYIPTAVIVYDLIPLLEREKYLDHDHRIEEYYFEGLSYLRNADLFLSISDFSKNELIDTLGIPAGSVINILAAAESHFKPSKPMTDQDLILKRRFGLQKPFVMYSGATDERKNHKRLIEAFAQLPEGVRANYQLAIVGKINQADTTTFQEHAQRAGLSASEMVITGEVSDDELIQLYSTTELFVFPSWHEGFGLPALEAMSCGAPVIAANTTSLPEVVGRDDVLFDPFDVSAITSKMRQALLDPAFREELSAFGLRQAENFSWDNTAKRALAAFEQFQQNRAGAAYPKAGRRQRQRLAFISPVPPERTGIADYAAELLPELAIYYDIYVITPQRNVLGDWLNEHCEIKDVDWFKQNHMLFERVLYQFGNSPFHSHMVDLLSQKPGVVILHDFYLSAMLHHMDAREWLNDLYRSHGYPAVADVAPAFEDGQDLLAYVDKYPSNARVTDKALGVIVHSQYSRSLGRQWGRLHNDDWAVVPLLRSADVKISRTEARKALGIDDQDFVICSFGFLDPVKQNHRLLSAFSSSTLADAKSCRLYFVGENHAGEYGAALKDAIANSGLSDRIKITGWVSGEDYQKYVAAADMAVQLRASSRGETSAAVLDCMKFGLPTIVNANGSLAELPKDSVYMLSDTYSDAELRDALTELWSDAERREDLSERAAAMIVSSHSPRVCARAYAEAIESFYDEAAPARQLLDAICAIDVAPVEGDVIGISQAIAQNRGRQRQKQLLIDVSALVRTSLKTGVERVVDKILRFLLLNPPDGYRVEPVYANAQTPGYQYARSFSFKTLGVENPIFFDGPVEAGPGDIFLGLDLEQYVVSFQSDYYKRLRRDGVEVYFVVYDLLPVLLPGYFPTWAERAHADWLNVVQSATGLVAISRTVADELSEWIGSNGQKGARPAKLGWFHLGADLGDHSKSDADAGRLPEFSAIDDSPTFLMVGTIEPRKGHLQVVEAFEKLWVDGVKANLIIVGGEGWKGLVPEERSIIKKTTDAIARSPQLNRHLFWFGNVSDGGLDELYARADCLIAASFGEGFGLPLIEAARHNLPVLARNIAVFREVAGGNATYFDAEDGATLSASIKSWLEDKAGRPAPAKFSWLTWEQSAAQLLDVIMKGRWYK